MATCYKKEFDLTHIKTVSQDVKAADLQMLLEKYNDNKFDVLIAVGGGSVIDMAKLMALFISNPSSIGIVEYLKSPAPPARSVLPLIAVPITAGTGSENTPFAVVYHDKVKYSVDCPELVPVKSFLVTPFLKSLSHRQRAQTALDAFAQAIESFWNVNSTADSDLYALLSVKDAKSARLAWHSYMAVGDIKPNLQNYGIVSQSDLCKIMKFGFNPAGMRNNPRLVSSEWVESMLTGLDDKVN